eukprot:CAMPEP_0185790192 /NCGR_PEP_ID=MMETSP1174-20130828/154954_1 /TAXON_ID=35687 /ORGANISM="Dictyocha speculum, Strain CCMP1381" /LENGTH=53 /DNA_ID=CAMNT_0028484747 /DNA_START=201 /DNA_END=358 /DNA_ORIENTATION=-
MQLDSGIQLGIDIGKCNKGCDESGFTVIALSIGWKSAGSPGYNASFSGYKGSV